MADPSYFDGLGVVLFWAGVLSFSTTVMGLPTGTGNITVPNAFPNHGDPLLVCTPTTWSDIVIFYFGNYIAHAATVRTYPGESGFDCAVNAFVAILLPTAGIARGIDAIVRRSALAEGELRKAVRAGALRMVIRSKSWKPRAGDRVFDFKLDDDGRARANTQSLDQDSPDSLDKDDVGLEEQVQANTQFPNQDSPDDEGVIKAAGINVSSYSPDWIAEGWKYWKSIHHSGVHFLGRKVHGLYELSEDYVLAPVPHDAVIRDKLLVGSQGPTTPLGQSSVTTAVCSVFNLPQVAASLFQTLYASFTLYRARGDQISRYGYAAFSLTVAPYAVMSFINLIGGLLTPTYPTLYLVGSSIMKEAESRGARFDGVIGEISEDPEAAGCEGTFSSDKRVEDGTALIFRLSDAKKSGDMGREQSRTEGERFTVIEPSPGGSGGYPVLHIPSCPKFERINSPRNSAPRRPSKRTRGFALWVCVAIGSISIAIVGGLSGFRPGQSTMAERVWTMMWLIFGVTTGGPVAFLAELTDADFGADDDLELKNFIHRMLGAYHLCVALLYGVPAVGGFVFVGKMLLEYGSCVRV